MRSFTFFFLFALTLHTKAQTTDTTGRGEIKKQIGHVSIIGLGEEGHGYASLNASKAAFTGFLRDEMNFNAVLFEAPFVESVIAYLEKDPLENRTRNFLYPFWNTGPVKKALEPFAENEKTLARPLVLGFDVQEDCRFEKLSKYLIGKKIITMNQDRLRACDSVLALYIGKKPLRKGALLMQENILMLKHYSAIAEELKSKNLDALEKKLLLRCMESRKQLCYCLMLTSTGTRMFFRDKQMADNIAWLSKELYPQDKIILWSANTHISKQGRKKHPEWMGQWLYHEFPEKYFAIAFRKGKQRKQFSWNGKQLGYSTKRSKKFDMRIYVEQLVKIKAEEWVTPCE